MSNKLEFIEVYTSGRISEMSIPVLRKYYRINESCQSLYGQENNEHILLVIEINQGSQIYIIYTMGATQRLLLCRWI